jgi:hypothetical protein
MYFSAFCEQAGTEVLLGPDNFVDLIDGPAGFELHYRCHCGWAGTVWPKSGAAGQCRPPNVHCM